MSYSVESYIHNGQWFLAATLQRIRFGKDASGHVRAPDYADWAAAFEHAANAPRAIVPYDHYRESRRLRRLKRARTDFHAHPHTFYRYANGNPRPIKNWLFKAGHKTHPCDSSYMQPVGAIPLPGAVQPQPTQRPLWLPTPAMRPALPDPTNYYPQELSHAR